MRRVSSSRGLKRYFPKKTTASEPAQVIRVVDGDTILVRFANGQQSYVRMLGINAPELHSKDTLETWYGGEASKWLERYLSEYSFADPAQLVPEGITVYLAPDPGSSDRDEYGRLLRYVYIQHDVTGHIEETVQYAVARQGLARPLYNDYNMTLAAARAFTNKEGIWGEPFILDLIDDLKQRGLWYVNQPVDYVEQAKFLNEYGFQTDYYKYMLNDAWRFERLENLQAWAPSGSSYYSYLINMMPEYHPSIPTKDDITRFKQFFDTRATQLMPTISSFIGVEKLLTYIESQTGIELTQYWQEYPPAGPPLTLSIPGWIWVNLPFLNQGWYFDPDIGGRFLGYDTFFKMPWDLRRGQNAFIGLPFGGLTGLISRSIYYGDFGYFLNNLIYQGNPPLGWPAFPEREDRPELPSYQHVAAREFTITEREFIWRMLQATPDWNPHTRTWRSYSFNDIMSMDSLSLRKTLQDGIFALEPTPENYFLGILAPQSPYYRYPTAEETVYGNLFVNIPAPAINDYYEGYAYPTGEAVNEWAESAYRRGVTDWLLHPDRRKSAYEGGFDPTWGPWGMFDIDTFTGAVDTVLNKFLGSYYQLLGRHAIADAASWVTNLFSGISLFNFAEAALEEAQARGETGVVNMPIINQDFYEDINREARTAIITGLVNIALFGLWPLAPAGTWLGEGIIGKAFLAIAPAIRNAVAKGIRVAIDKIKSIPTGTGIISDMVLDKAGMNELRTYIKNMDEFYKQYYVRPETAEIFSDLDALLGSFKGEFEKIATGTKVNTDIYSLSSAESILDALKRISNEVNLGVDAASHINSLEKAVEEYTGLTSKIDEKIKRFEELDQRARVNALTPAELQEYADLRDVLTTGRMFSTDETARMTQARLTAAAEINWFKSNFGDTIQNYVIANKDVQPLYYWIDLMDFANARHYTLEELLAMGPHGLANTVRSAAGDYGPGSKLKALFSTMSEGDAYDHLLSSIRANVSSNVIPGMEIGTIPGWEVSSKAQEIIANNEIPLDAFPTYSRVRKPIYTYTLRDDLEKYLESTGWSEEVKQRIREKYNEVEKLVAKYGGWNTPLAQQKLHELYTSTEEIASTDTTSILYNRIITRYEDVARTAPFFPFWVHVEEPAATRMATDALTKLAAKRGMNLTNTDELHEMLNDIYYLVHGLSQISSDQRIALFKEPIMKMAEDPHTVLEILKAPMWTPEMGEKLVIAMFGDKGKQLLAKSTSGQLVMKFLLSEQLENLDQYAYQIRDKAIKKWLETGQLEYEDFSKLINDFAYEQGDYGMLSKLLPEQTAALQAYFVEIVDYTKKLKQSLEGLGTQVSVVSRKVSGLSPELPVISPTKIQELFPYRFIEEFKPAVQGDVGSQITQQLEFAFGNAVHKFAEYAATLLKGGFSGDIVAESAKVFEQTLEQELSQAKLTIEQLVGGPGSFEQAFAQAMHGVTFDTIKENQLKSGQEIIKEFFDKVGTDWAKKLLAVEKRIYSEEEKFKFSGIADMILGNLDQATGKLDELTYVDIKSTLAIASGKEFQLASYAYFDKDFQTAIKKLEYWVLAKRRDELINGVLAYTGKYDPEFKKLSYILQGRNVVEEGTGNITTTIDDIYRTLEEASDTLRLAYDVQVELKIGTDVVRGTGKTELEATYNALTDYIQNLRKIDPALLKAQGTLVALKEIGQITDRDYIGYFAGIQPLENGMYRPLVFTVTKDETFSTTAEWAEKDLLTRGVRVYWDVSRTADGKYLARALLYNKDLGVFEEDVGLRHTFSNANEVLEWTTANQLRLLNELDVVSYAEEDTAKQAALAEEQLGAGEALSTGKQLYTSLYKYGVVFRESAAANAEVAALIDEIKRAKADLEALKARKAPTEELEACMERMRAAAEKLYDLGIDETNIAGMGEAITRMKAEIFTADVLTQYTEIDKSTTELALPEVTSIEEAIDWLLTNGEIAKYVDRREVIDVLQAIKAKLYLDAIMGTTFKDPTIYSAFDTIKNIVDHVKDIDEKQLQLLVAIRTSLAKAGTALEENLKGPLSELVELLSQTEEVPSPIKGLRPTQAWRLLLALKERGGSQEMIAKLYTYYVSASKRQRALRSIIGTLASAGYFDMHPELIGIIGKAARETGFVPEVYKDIRYEAIEDLRERPWDPSSPIQYAKGSVLTHEEAITYWAKIEAMEAFMNYSIGIGEFRLSPYEWFNLAPRYIGGKWQWPRRYLGSQFKTGLEFLVMPEYMFIKYFGPYFSKTLRTAKQFTRIYSEVGKYMPEAFAKKMASYYSFGRLARNEIARNLRNWYIDTMWSYRLLGSMYSRAHNIFNAIMSWIPGMDLMQGLMRYTKTLQGEYKIEWESRYQYYMTAAILAQSYFKYDQETYNKAIKTINEILSLNYEALVREQAQAEKQRIRWRQPVKTTGRFGLDRDQTLMDTEYKINEIYGKIAIKEQELSKMFEEGDTMAKYQKYTEESLAVEIQGTIQSVFPEFSFTEQWRPQYQFLTQYYKYMASPRLATPEALRAVEDVYNFAMSVVGEELFGPGSAEMQAKVQTALDAAAKLSGLGVYLPASLIEDVIGWSKVVDQFKSKLANIPEEIKQSGKPATAFAYINYMNMYGKALALAEEQRTSAIMNLVSVSSQLKNIQDVSLAYSNVAASYGYMNALLSTESLYSTLSRTDDIDYNTWFSKYALLLDQLEFAKATENYYAKGGDEYASELHKAKLTRIQTEIEIEKWKKQYPRSEMLLPIFFKGQYVQQDVEAAVRSMYGISEYNLEGTPYVPHSSGAQVTITPNITTTTTTSPTAGWLDAGASAQRRENIIGAVGTFFGLGSGQKKNNIIKVVGYKGNPAELYKELVKQAANFGSLLRGKIQA